MLTTPLMELPPSLVATLENWIIGGTAAFAAVVLCCAGLKTLHSNTVRSESGTTRAWFMTCLHLSVFSDCFLFRERCFDLQRSITDVLIRREAKVFFVSFSLHYSAPS